MAGVVDLFLIYSFIRRLATPFNEWKAYELGIIDEKGNLLKKRKELRMVKEREAFGLFDLLVLKLKKLLEKVPGGNTRIGSYAAALWLIKEHKQYLDRADVLTEEELSEAFAPYMLTEGVNMSTHPDKVIDTDLYKGYKKFWDKRKPKKSKEDKTKKKPVKEDAPVNSAGSGNIAGIGVGPDGEPPMGKKAQKKYVKNAKKRILKRYEEPLDIDLGD